MTAKNDRPAQASRPRQVAVEHTDRLRNFWRREYDHMHRLYGSEWHKVVRYMEFTEELVPALLRRIVPGVAQEICADIDHELEIFKRHVWSESEHPRWGVPGDAALIGRVMFWLERGVRLETSADRMHAAETVQVIERLRAAVSRLQADYALLRQCENPLGPCLVPGPGSDRAEACKRAMELQETCGCQCHQVQR